MRLADLVISYSLEINNRCLRYLAESHTKGWGAADVAVDGSTESHTVYAENTLARDSRRLVSMWTLVEASVLADEMLKHHYDQLCDVSADLTERTAPKRLALRLASLAQEEEDATALLKVARALPQQQGPIWSRLNDLFTADSAAWRDTRLFDALMDDDIIETIRQGYRRGYRLSRTLLKSSDSRDTLLPDLEAVACCTAHQMELLRDGLSDTGKHHVWYFGKLTDALNMHRSLRGLEAFLPDLDVKKRVRKLSGTFIAEQKHKIGQRIEKLLPGAYATKPKRMGPLLTQSLKGLDSVVNMSHSRVIEVEMAQEVPELQETQERPEVQEEPEVQEAQRSEIAEIVLVEPPGRTDSAEPTSDENLRGT